MPGSSFLIANAAVAVESERTAAPQSRAPAISLCVRLDCRRRRVCGVSLNNAQRISLGQVTTSERGFACRGLVRIMKLSLLAMYEMKAYVMMFTPNYPISMHKIPLCIAFCICHKNVRDLCKMLPYSMWCMYKLYSPPLPEGENDIPTEGFLPFFHFYHSKSKLKTERRVRRYDKQISTSILKFCWPCVQTFGF